MTIKPNSIIYSLLSKLKNGYWKPNLYSTDLILEQYFKVKKEGCLIQIGSNDGLTNDPLHKHLVRNPWKAILIEPIPEIFEELKKNYLEQGNRIQFENSIISSTDSQVNFYTLKKEVASKYPEYVSQLSSMKKDVLLRLKNEFPAIENDIDQLNLSSITFESLINKYRLDNVDLIHIDAEGSDDKILATIKIEDYLPDIVLFEHVHLNLKSYKEILRRFKNLDYQLYYFDFDTIAVNREFQKKHKKIGKMNLF